MGSRAVQRAEAFFEVLVAGFGGWLLIMLAVGLMGLQGSDILASPVGMACALIAEATITLFLIRFLEASSFYGGSSVFALVRWSPAELLVGLASVPFLFLAVIFSGLAFELTFPQYASEGNPLLEKINTMLDLVFFVVAGVYAGGIKEEVQRGFILLRFEKHLGGILAGLVLWSLVFGFGHYEQGWSSAFSAAVLGLIFGCIFLWKRNLLTAISVHAVYDVAVLLFYWNYVRN